MKSTELVALGQIIKRLRRQKGWSQGVLAERVSLHRTYIGGIERGERNITYKTLIALREALGCKIHDLFPESIQK